MTTHAIRPEHRATLARQQHVLEWLQAERTRLQAELTHIAHWGMRAEGQLRDFLAGEYSIGVETPFTLDVEAGTIQVPDPAPEAAPAPVQDATETIAADRRQSRK